MFSKFYQLDVHKKNCVQLANLQWSIENWTSIDFGYQQCMFVDSLIEHMGPPNRVR